MIQIIAQSSLSQSLSHSLRKRAPSSINPVPGQASIFFWMGGKQLLLSVSLKQGIQMQGTLSVCAMLIWVIKLRLDKLVCDPHMCEQICSRFNFQTVQTNWCKEMMLLSHNFCMSLTSVTMRWNCQTCIVVFLSSQKPLSSCHPACWCLKS